MYMISKQMISHRNFKIMIELFEVFKLHKPTAIVNYFENQKK